MKKANQVRTTLLTYINKESNSYLRNKCTMKINSRTSQEILSQFETYEVQITHSVITCTSSRSTVKINKMISRKNSTKIEDGNVSDEIPLCPEINLYINEIEQRKVLFSKKKLKHLPSLKEIKVKANQPNYDNKKEHSQKLIKKAMLFLHKIAHKIKIPTHNKNRKKEVASSKLLLKPRKKPMSMKIAEMKKITQSTKKHSYQISNNEFKINLHKLDGDIMSDETNDNDNISSNSNSKHNLCCKRKKNNKYVDSSMSDDDEK